MKKITLLVPLSLLLLSALPSAASEKGDAKSPATSLVLPEGFFRLGPDLIAGGQPSRADLEAFRKAGFKTIFNLRADDESGVAAEETSIKELGLGYVQMPVSVDTVGEKQVEAFRQILNDPSKRPIVVHCKSSNRVGMMFAIQSAVDGKKSLEAAEADGIAAGLASDGAKEKFRELATKLGAK